MRVSQEVKLVRGSELCKLSLSIGDFDTAHLVTSHALQLRRMSQSNHTIQWEGSTRIELSARGDLSQRVIESLVAMKVRDGFRVLQHLSVLPDQEPILALFHGPALGVASDPRLRAGETLPPGDATIPPANVKHMDDYVTFGDPAKVQKERKGGTSIYHLAQYFHHPINEAAKLLDICPTVLKKICRRHGLRRWPHRKLKSIQKSIERLEASYIDLQHEPGKEHQLLSISTKVMELKQERAVLCFNMGATAVVDDVNDNDDT